MVVGVVYPRGKETVKLASFKVCMHSSVVFFIIFFKSFAESFDEQN